MSEATKDFLHDFVEDEIGDTCIICGRNREEHLTQSAQLTKFRTQAQELQEELETRNNFLDAVTRERDGLRVELKNERVEKEKYFRRLLKIEKEYNSLVEFANQQQKNIKEMQLTMADVTERQHGLGRHAFIWGHNRAGQLSRKNRLDVVVDPVESRQLQDIGKMKGFVHVACGKQFTCAITLDGDLYAWGDNREGQLGNGKRGYNTHVPQLVKGDLEGHHVVLVECGEYHTAAVTDKGRLFTWGYGLDGQLGHGEKHRLEYPKEVQAIKNTEFVISVACGASHTVCVVVSNENKSNTVVLAWGRNKEGQAGLKGLAEQTVPARLETLKEFRMSHVAAGEDHTVAFDGHVLTAEEEGKVKVEKGELDNLTKKIVLNMDPEKAAQAEAFGGQVSETTEAAAATGTAAPAASAAGGGGGAGVGAVGGLGDPQGSDFHATKALKLHNQHLMNELENQEAIFSAEYKETKRTVNRFFHLWLRLRETSIERLNPNVAAQLDGGKQKIPSSLDKLVELSNEAIDSVSAEARDLAMQGKGDLEIRYQLADLLSDNAVLRKAVNDFTEGILIHTSDNLRKFHEKFDEERKRQAAALAAREKLNVFGKDKKDKSVVKDELGRETKKIDFGMKLANDEDLYEDAAETARKEKEKGDPLPPWRAVVKDLVKEPKEKAHREVAKKKLSRSRDRLKSRSRSAGSGKSTGDGTDPSGAESGGERKGRKKMKERVAEMKYARADAQDKILAAKEALKKKGSKATDAAAASTKRAVEKTGEKVPGSSKVMPKRKEEKPKGSDGEDEGVLASLISAFTGGSTSRAKKTQSRKTLADEPADSD